MTPHFSIIKLRREVEPDTVFAPSGPDRHHDRKAIYSEAMRTFLRGAPVNSPCAGTCVVVRMKV